jgi:LysR family transcriptional regulator, glycine cleavage system transcriptional activator
MVPPLIWLRAFEAAGRLGSFKAAAAALNVSPSTVSHQIRDLEIMLGVPLFSRGGRSIELTEEGLRYLAPLTAAFALIGSAFESVPNTREHFRIGAFPFLTNEVLAPNMDKLKLALGCSRLSFRSESGFALLLHASPGERLDVVVRYASGPLPAGLLSLDLFDIGLVPIQAVGKPPVPDIETLLSQPTIRVLGPFDAWRAWTEHHHIDRRPTHIVMETDNYHLAALAAARGDGMCLGVMPFMHPWVASGRIEALDQFRCTIPFKACLVYAPHNQDNPAIVRLRDWLVGQLT